ncbi:MAG: cupin domain-containing protein [Clostridia bacterium]|nr:cupin domain-containing protein [Clostridia bacterium]
MVIDQKDMELQLRENMRGGNGTVKIKHMFKDELPQKCRFFAEIVLDPGCSIGFHQHEQETEIYYFLSGKGVVDDDGVKKEVFAGCAMSTGEGKGHSVENTGDSPLKFIAVIILN